MDDGELFNVVQFFPDESYEYVERGMRPEEAVNLAKRLTESLGARVGLVSRLIITDSGDFTCFEWRYGEGAIFPPQKAPGEGQPDPNRAD